MSFCLTDEKGLTFDDVLLVPQYSEVSSRKNPDVKVSFDNNVLSGPIFAAPMNTLCEARMAIAMENYGDGVIHRYMTIEDQVLIAKTFLAAENKRHPFFAVGASRDFKERIESLLEVGVRKFCIDVANGNTKVSIDACKFLRKESLSSSIMAGNVANGDGYYRLIDAGANLVRVGIGSGANCVTRQVTGHGMPQISALASVRKAKQQLNLKDDEGIIISDGGIRSSADMIKALAIADSVMLGSMLAGTDESPGEVFSGIDRLSFKIHSGMASAEARKASHIFTKEETGFVPEGVSARIPYVGSVIPILENLINSLKVGMTYTGANTLKEFRERSEMIQITYASHIEGAPHVFNKK